MHANPYAVGSTDGVLKGGGLAKELAESLGFSEKVARALPATRTPTLTTLPNLTA